MSEFVLYIEGFLGSLEPVLRHLDPSLFQNVIIGILAIFIPFAIVLLTDILGSNEPSSEFEKMVLTEEVFGIKNLFWFSVGGISFFSFFADEKESVSIYEKLFVITIAAFLIWLFWKSFRRVLRFSEGYKYEFKISFLQSLRLPESLYFDNKSIKDKILKSWSSFWMEKTVENERSFTKIFSKHIDDAINYKEFDLAVNLSQCYKDNFEKRNLFHVGFVLLPKILEWTEKIWNEEQEQKRLKHHSGNDLSFYESRKGRMHFQTKLFPHVVRSLIVDSYTSNSFFEDFKKHIENKEREWEASSNLIWKRECESYIKLFLQVFFKEFFDLMIDGKNLSFKSLRVFDEDFPEEWKITDSNSGNRISKEVLNNFIQWGRTRRNRVLVDVSGLFPNVASDLFSDFLSMFFSYTTKDAITRDQEFFLSRVYSSWGNSNEEARRRRIQEEEQEEIRESIHIIFNYFSVSWKPLMVTRDDVDKECSKWNECSEERKKEIFDSIRRKNLKRLLEELDGNQEIKKLCEQKESYEARRKGFVRLVNLLLDSLSLASVPE